MQILLSKMENILISAGLYIIIIPSLYECVVWG